MNWVEVTTQKQWDAVIRAGNGIIVRQGLWIAYGSSQVRACDSSQVRACDSSQVRACGSSQVTACGSSQVTAYGSSQVTAYDSSQVTAYGSSQVRACGSSQVRACGSSQVTAYGSSQVTAYGSSQVTAYGSSQVRAYGSSQVRAYGSSQVTAYGRTPKVTGGSIIKAANPLTVKAWLTNYGLTSTDGVVVLFKAVRDNWQSTHGGDYRPGTVPVAPDWDGGKQECGGGLHFSPFPWMALSFDNAATRFVGCPVRVSQIRRPHADDQFPNKVKASGCCGPVFEVDQDGNRKEEQ